MLTMLTLLILQSAVPTELPAPPHDPIPDVSRGPWISLADYPRAALAERRSGMVRTRLRVNRRGAVDSCEVVVSSGHADIDVASCRLLSERGRFHPARDVRGRAIAAPYSYRVQWTLPPAT